MRLESNLEDPSSWQMLGRRGHYGYQAGQAQIGGLTKGVSLVRIGLGWQLADQGREPWGLLGLSRSFKVKKVKLDARVWLFCTACRHSLSGRACSHLERQTRDEACSSHAVPAKHAENSCHRITLHASSTVARPSAGPAAVTLLRSPPPNEQP